jgi:hypothetical protein
VIILNLSAAVLSNLILDTVLPQVLLPFFVEHLYIQKNPESNPHGLHTANSLHKHNLLQFYLI